MVRYPGGPTVADYAVAYADQAGLAVQGHENREAKTSRATRIGPRPSRRSPPAAGAVPPAVRPGLPRRPGFALRESRWYATEARFGFRCGIPALPASGFARGCQPSQPA